MLKEDNINPLSKEDIEKLKEFLIQIDPNGKVFNKAHGYINLKEKTLMKNEKNKVK